VLCVRRCVSGPEDAKEIALRAHFNKKNFSELLKKQIFFKCTLFIPIRMHTGYKSIFYKSF